MAGVELQARVCGGHMVVALCGQLDATEAEETAAVLRAVAGRGRRVIVDLAGLEFIDCSALSQLCRAQQAARAVGGDVLLAAPSGKVAQLLELTGRNRALEVHASVAAAAASASHADASARLARTLTQPHLTTPRPGRDLRRYLAVDPRRQAAGLGG